MIFTFYSFKGGVGRSMALANIAELFYARGLKVLMVDFDLEAPGLERYFDVTTAATPLSEIPGRRGVIDAILSFQELQSFAPKVPPTRSLNAEAAPAFPFSVEPLSNFIVPIYDATSHPGKLSLLPSGNRRKPDFAAYAKRVLELDWGRFYTEMDGERFFEWFRQELIRDWDVVLIDSRTGVTELGGVCTHHLADAVISFVATNLQNLDGSAMMARSLANPELMTKGRKGRSLKQLLVPSRVELSEEDKHDKFASRFNQELSGFFPTDQTPERTWFLDLRLLYVAAYSYLESVAVREPERASKADLIQAYGRLAARMASIAGSGALFDSYAPAQRTFSNVPSRNPYFTGRDEELKRLRALFPSGTPMAVCGLAGMGKTALAIEYAYRYRNEYRSTLFCRAGSEDELGRGCEEIARLLSLGAADIQPRDAVRGWLERNDGWLLIIDDTDDPALARTILPASLRGHVLYTTRTQQVSALGAQPLILDSLPLDATLGFFQKRLGRPELNESERSAAAQLVEEVGALPLAVEQAAAYIANRNSRIQDYLASYRKRRLGLLDQQSAVSAGREVSVSAVLEPTLEEIEKTPASADVLRIASFLASDPIPTLLLAGGSKHLGDAIASALAGAADDPLALDEVLDPLTRFSLIVRDLAAQAFSVHRIVSALVRARVRDGASWQQRIALALDATFPEPAWETVPVCVAMIPHVMAVLTSVNAPRLRIRAGQYFLLRGDAIRAEECLRQAIVPSEKGPETIIALDLLAQACFAQSRFADAIELLRHAVELSDQLGLGAAMGTRLSLDLAEAHAASGSLEQAGQLFLAVIDESEKRSDIATVVAALCGYAGILSQSKPEEGVKFAELALAKAERIGRPWALATALQALSNALIAAGAAAELRTIEVLTKSLAVAEQVYGPVHPSLAKTLLTYSILLHAQGRESEAQAVYQRGQTIIDRALGPGSKTSTEFRGERERMLALLREHAPSGTDEPAPAT